MSLIAGVAQGQANYENVFSFHKPSVLIRYHRATGRMDIEWSDGKKLVGLISSAVLDDGRQISTASYPAHSLDKPQQVPADAEVYTIRSTAPGLPDLLQRIWLYDGNLPSPSKPSWSRKERRSERGTSTLLCSRVRARSAWARRNPCASFTCLSTTICGSAITASRSRTSSRSRWRPATK